MRISHQFLTTRLHDKQVEVVIANQNSQRKAKNLFFQVLLLLLLISLFLLHYLLLLILLFLLFLCYIRNICSSKHGLFSLFKLELCGNTASFPTEFRRKKGNNIFTMSGLLHWIESSYFILAFLHLSIHRRLFVCFYILSLTGVCCELPCYHLGENPQPL